MIKLLSRASSVLAFVLLAGMWLASPARAQDLSDSFSASAGNSGATPASPSPMLQPVSFGLSATYYNQPTSPSSYSSLNGPNWQDWTFSVQFSEDGTTYNNAPSTTYDQMVIVHALGRSDGAGWPARRA